MKTATLYPFLFAKETESTHSKQCITVKTGGLEYLCLTSPTGCPCQNCQRCRNEIIDVEQKSKLVGADPVGRESYIVLKKADNLSKGVR